MKNKFITTTLYIVIFLTNPLLQLFGNEERLPILNEIRKAVLFASNGHSVGTGFACIYRDQEFVATNLHVASGQEHVAFKTQNGKVIELGDRMILANDADICLYSVIKPFSAYGIEALTFSSNVQEDVKIGDKVFCLGNSLGNEVIIQSDGEFKAYGSPRIEVTTPFVGGNSGGPLIHHKTGKVIGLITETKENTDAEKNTNRGRVAIASKQADLSQISYFAHRIDTVKQWQGTTREAFLNSEKEIEKYSDSIENTIFFFVDESGWEKDESLVKIWDEYKGFIEESKRRTSTRVRTTYYTDGFGTVIRRDVRERKKSVSQADYDTAYRKFIRGIDWKIKSDQTGIQKLQPQGYYQIKKVAVLNHNLDLAKKLFEHFKSGS